MAKKENKTKEQKESKKAFGELIKAYKVADDLQNDGDDDTANKLRGILRKVEKFITKQT
jgi:DNA-binding ferritin-like protein